MRESVRFRISLTAILILKASLGGADEISAPESERQLATALHRAAEARAVVADPESPDRAAAVTEMINLAGTKALPETEAEAWLRWAAKDVDPRVARQAQAWVASKERRDVGLGPPWTKQREERLRRSLSEISLALDQEDPRFRKQALVMLLEVARSERRCSGQAVRDLFELAADDPDIRVSRFARFALEGGLDGDEDALRQVWVAPEGGE